jgi:D-glycerate 3-kinase
VEKGSVLPSRHDLHPDWRAATGAGIGQSLTAEQVRTASEFLTPLLPGLSPSIISELYVPLGAWLAAKVQDDSLVVSLSGVPGTGKSTLVSGLGALLTTIHGLKVAAFSLDDVYLSQQERRLLARRIHPLLLTRGVPGTHDVQLAERTIRQLTEAGSRSVSRLPRFDKRTDDRLAEAGWPQVLGRPDIILVDGWFWGAKAAQETTLREPVNDREMKEDAVGTWRRFVNRRLAGEYQGLFDCSKLQLHLHAPNWAACVRWRIQQERDLLRAAGADPAGLSEASIVEFLKLFERVAHLKLRSQPQLVMRLNDRHELAGLEFDPEGPISLMG